MVNQGTWKDMIFEEVFESSLFFLLKGEVGLYKNLQKLLTVPTHRAFNELAFMTNVPTSYSAKSLTHTSMFYIQRRKKKDFMELLREILLFT